MKAFSTRFAHANGGLRFISRRSYEISQFFRQQASKSYGRSVLPIWTHNLNPYWQPGFCLTDGRNRSWATCKCSWGTPVGHVEVGFDTARGEDGALVLRFAMVVCEGSRESYRRQKDIDLIEICLPLRPELESSQVLPLPFGKRTKGRRGSNEPIVSSALWIGASVNWRTLPAQLFARLAV
jgi:hypothetical protein